MRDASSASFSPLRSFISFLPPNELSDPLLVAAGMKPGERPEVEAPHVTAAHGDPLLKEAEHSHKLALHAELHGQGDPLLDAALEKSPAGAKDALMGTGHTPDHKRLGAGEKHVPRFNHGEGGGHATSVTSKAIA